MLDGLVAIPGAWSDWMIDSPLVAPLGSERDPPGTLAQPLSPVLFCSSRAIMYGVGRASRIRQRVVLLLEAVEVRVGAVAVLLVDGGPA